MNDFKQTRSFKFLRTNHIVFLIFFFQFNFTISFGQENVAGRVIQPSSDSIKNNAASIVFDKSFNTYRWAGSAFINKTFGSFFLHINEQLQSTIIRTDKKLITDNQILNLNLGRIISRTFTATAKLNSFILSDNKSMGGSISKAASHSGHLGIMYFPFGGFSIEPSAGFSFDNQLDRFDKGPSYLLNYSLQPSQYFGYLIYSEGRFRIDNIDPRKMETRNINLNIEKSFSKHTNNSLSFSYYKIRRDFYFTGDTVGGAGTVSRYNIETRSDNAINIADSLRYGASNDLSWSLFGSVFSREIDRTVKTGRSLSFSGSDPNSTINEFKIDGGIRMLFKPSERLNSSVAFFYQERDEKHITETNEMETRIGQGERRNNKTRHTSLSSAITWIASRSDTFTFSGSSHMLRYDTPSRENNDDRDELLYLLNLSTSHRLSSLLSMEINADVTLGHLVYLFASRSADNSWNRIIRLSPKLDYHPLSYFQTVNIFEVLANYTVYDFEDPSSRVQSYVFRQFAFLDSSSLMLTNRLRLEWFSHIRLYERGEFRWNSFSERPVNYFEDKTYLCSVSYLPSAGLLFSLGIRYFNQLRFDYTEQKYTLEHYLKSIGPTTRILISSGSTDFAVSGWYEHQTQTNQPARGYITMAMTLNVKI